MNADLQHWHNFFSQFNGVSAFAGGLKKVKLFNEKFSVRSDNMTVVNIMNRQTSMFCKVMQLWRLFVLHCLQFNVTIRAKHVSGILNVLADSLLRSHLHKFRILAQDADARRHSSPISDLSRLRLETNSLANSALAANTVRVYDHGLQLFYRFSESYGLEDSWL